MFAKPESEALVAALNYLTEYAAQHLPPEWQVVVTLEKTQAAVTLFDPTGDEAFFLPCDVSLIVDACEEAKKIQTTIDATKPAEIEDDQECY